MFWDDQKVLANIRQAETDDLLDRITAYRPGMEEAAIRMIEQELRSRGVTSEEIARHQDACERACLFLPDGTAMTCSFCRKPAVVEGWGWHWLWQRLPLFPRRFRYCREHAEEFAGRASDE